MLLNGKPRFVIIDAIGQSEQKICLPVVTAMFNPELKLNYNEIDLQDAMAQSHWYISGYKMAMHHPLTRVTGPLFNDIPAEQAMFRVVVKSNLTMAMAQHMMREMENAVQFLDA